VVCGRVDRARQGRRRACGLKGAIFVFKGNTQGLGKSNRLDGKVALITGGSRGIEAAIALRFAAEGERVVISYKRNRAGRRIGGCKLTEQGGDGIAIRVVGKERSNPFGPELSSATGHWLASR
jgi:hypothetical protein